MVSIKKSFQCRCGASNSFDFSSDMQIEDITISARCGSCGSSLCLSISAMLQSSPQQNLPPAQDKQTQLPSYEQESRENVEQAVRDLFK